tara:strand:- start:11284 stop:11463 length:180 start_codon:yes stop_codon:yes gene_type:complete
MEAKITKKTKDLLIISWDKEDVGFGQLTLKWDVENNRYDLDAELMGIDTVIEIFKSCKE